MSIEYWMVGCGNMGSALVEGALKAGAHCVVRSRSRDKIDRLLSLGASETSNGGPRVVVFAVKPYQLEAVFSEFEFQEGDIVVSVAAGVRLASLKAWLPKKWQGLEVVRAMPNTPALVGKGMTGLFSDSVSDEVVAFFEMSGEVVVLSSESEFDALTALSGSGPAYIFIAMQALADGGVQMGLSRDVATKLAIGTVLGAAELASQSGTHFEVLKDRVTSPGGTTIAACAELEKLGFRHALNRAVVVAAEHSKSMAEKLS